MGEIINPLLEILSLSKIEMELIRRQDWRWMGSEQV